MDLKGELKAFFLHIVSLTLVQAYPERVRLYHSRLKAMEKPSSAKSVTLRVPYFPQRDNYRDAYRTCFSSSCAMLVEFLRPGTLPGSKGDDTYIRKVFSYGDTTHSDVQLRALRFFGINAKFVTNGTFELLDSQLRKGIPVPIGILHKGSARRPSGGGHWLTVTGLEVDSKAPGGAWYIVNDPWGEIDHATGTYPNPDGRQKRYSKALLDSRWTVSGNSDGWAIIADKPE